MTPTLGWLAAQFAAPIPAQPERSLNPVSIDSRRVQAGDTFWALAGQRDGHDFIRDAFIAGAQAAVVSQSWAETQAGRDQLDCCIVVPDTTTALAQAGTNWRAQLACPVIGITGSNGKTTTKELISLLLSLKFRVVATAGNLNNQLGVPLTMLTVPGDADIAIIEMGASRFGEIGELCEICRPTHGLVTSIGRAHLEGFGTIAALAQTKGQLYDAVAENGTAFLPLDDELCRVEAASVRNALAYTFSVSANGFSGAVFQGRDYHLTSAGTAAFVFAGQSISLAVPGYPTALAALAAVTVAHHFEIPLDAAALALKSWGGVPGRGQVLKIGDLTIIDDTYNANPNSMKCALQTLATLPGRRVAILGAMAELGSYGADEHRRIAEEARSFGFSELILVGEMWKDVAGDTAYFPSVAELLEGLPRLVKAQDVVLLKGSRSIELERAVQYLREVRG
jgi:UDP-N-acetylmuramoyl-tripeptide--D-alanyl-D-alanine ligase